MPWEQPESSLLLFPEKCLIVFCEFLLYSKRSVPLKIGFGHEATLMKYGRCLDKKY
jgi:hypothetical protein